ncbi:MAG: glutathione S-transferase [Burkholderiales bacterium PBB4]|nr:MAG: glutathione S-transferase [Burkholderiales bacterium PBB4]
MTALTLHYHPLSSYCQKVLIALDAMGIDAEKRMLNLGDPAERAAFLALWPTGKMPLLVDQGQPVAESSIIIEYLQCHYAPEDAWLIPQDAAAALQVRLWDRLFDQYVMTPMQALTANLLRAEPQRDALCEQQARDKLAEAYAWIDAHLAGRTWAATDRFSLADCAAAPALFYAVTYVPFGSHQAHVRTYFERLMDYLPVARAVDAARPFFQYYPGRAGLSTEFFDPASSEPTPNHQLRHDPS